MFNWQSIISIRKLFIVLILSQLLITAACDVVSLPPNADTDAAIPLIKTTVTRVVDGDTVVARFPDGSEDRVRFIGVDTPETKHPTKAVEYFGEEADAFTRLHLENREVWLELDVESRDQYDRVLAYVWLVPPENLMDETVRASMFNAWLLLEGYAQMVTFPPNVKYVDLFRQYENEARENDRGLWANEAE